MIAFLGFFQIMNVDLKQNIKLNCFINAFDANFQPHVWDLNAC